jgi:hypothetical protein
MMEGEAASFTAFIVEVLRAYGLAGLVMLAMAFVIRALWQDNVFMRTSMFEIAQKNIEANAATASALTLLRTDLLSRKGGE